jgi:hypothetical protein
VADILALVECQGRKMRYLVVCSVMLLSACAQQQVTYSDPAEAAAAARCQAQGMTAGAPIRNVFESVMQERQVAQLCMQAWYLDRAAERQRQAAQEQRLTDAASQAARKATLEADAKRQAAIDCKGARNRDACMNAMVAAAVASASTAPAPTSASAIPAVNRGPATSDRPSYDW